MSAAQQAQQNNRDLGGRYTENQLADPGGNIGLGTFTFLNEDQFEDTYTVIQSPDGSDIWGHADMEEGSIPAERVWSVLDSNDGSTYVCPGFRIVNVYGYMVTEKPWTSPETTVVLSPRHPQLLDLVNEQEAERLEQQGEWILGEEPTACPGCGARTDFVELADGRQLHTCPRCSHTFIAGPPGDDDCPECGAGLNDDGTCPNCDDPNWGEEK